MDLLHILILSVIEGVTEFLPISSTGHLILGSKLLNIPNTEFLKTFEISIQSGAVLSIATLYWKKFVAYPNLILKALVGLFPTSVVGIIMYPFLKSFLLESIQTVSISLIIGGIVILFMERKFKNRGNKTDSKVREVSEVTYKQAFFTGLTQSIAIIPGVSRALASIFGGMMLGMSRKTATEFSFILALPTIFAATGFDLIQTGAKFDESQITALLIGTLISFVVALVTIKWLIRYVSSHNFTTFGWYRIAIGIILLLMFL